jgi:hypothetical protein
MSVNLLDGKRGIARSSVGDHAVADRERQRAYSGMDPGTHSGTTRPLIPEHPGRFRRGRAPPGGR